MTSPEELVFLAGGGRAAVHRRGDVVIRDTGPWTPEGAAALGGLLRSLHEATRSFRPAPDAVWLPWPGRHLGGPCTVFGHCDVAPWIRHRRTLEAGLSRGAGI